MMFILHINSGSYLISKFQKRSVLVSTDHLPLQQNVHLESVDHFDSRFPPSLG